MERNAKKYHLNRTFFSDPKVYGEVSLFQVGRLFCQPDTVINRHTQLSFIEFTAITGGKGVILTNGVPYEVTGGDIYASFPGYVHEIVSDSLEPLRYDFIAFDTSNADLRAELDRITLEFHSPECRLLREPRVSETVAKIIAEEGCDEPFSALVLESMIKELTVSAIRAFRGMSAAQSKSPDDVELFCYGLMNYIDTNIYEIKHLSELSEYANYSYNYLSNLYKTATGDTLVNYYRKRRMETAHRLLEEGGASITEIAELLNYSSVYTFSRAFKDYYGLSPKEVKSTRHAKN